MKTRIGTRLECYSATPRIGNRLDPYQVRGVDVPLLERTVVTPQGAVKSIDDIELGIRALRELHAPETQ